jgi:hypothetical protein
MSWQIYQAYFSGLHSLFRLFEQSFGRPSRVIPTLTSSNS